MEHEEARRPANLQDGQGVDEGVGHELVTSDRSAMVAAAPALRALLAGIIDGVQRGDVVSARASARALVALLEALPAPSGGGGNVIKLADRLAVYGPRKSTTFARVSGQ